MIKFYLTKHLKFIDEILKMSHMVYMTKTLWSKLYKYKLQCDYYIINKKRIFLNWNI